MLLNKAAPFMNRIYRSIAMGWPLTFNAWNSFASSLSFFSGSSVCLSDV